MDTWATRHDVCLCLHASDSLAKANESPWETITVTLCQPQQPERQATMYVSRSVSSSYCLNEDRGGAQTDPCTCGVYTVA